MNKFLFLLVAMAILGGCSRTSPDLSDQTVPVRFGVPLQPSAALIMLAVENGDFQRHGIEPRVTWYPSGKRALLEGLLRGEVDVWHSCVQRRASHW